MPRSTWTDDRIAILKAEWAVGTSVTKIATKLGISEPTVTSMRERLGLPTRKTGFGVKQNIVCRLIVQAIEQNGAMARAEIALKIRRTLGSVSSCIQRMRQQKMLYIAEYGHTGKQVTVKFALGDQPDAPRPKVSKEERKRRQREYAKRRYHVVNAKVEDMVRQEVERRIQAYKLQAAQQTGALGLIVSQLGA